MSPDQIRRSWDDDDTPRSVFPEPLAERLTRENKELRAALVRVRALGDAFADDGITRHGGNIAWHIEEAIANEKGDFPDAADQRIASQRERAEAAESRLDALVTDLRGIEDEWGSWSIGIVPAATAAKTIRNLLDKHAGEQP
jgi:hypothetical protein